MSKTPYQALEELAAQYWNSCSWTRPKVSFDLLVGAHRFEHYLLCYARLPPFPGYYFFDRWGITTSEPSLGWLFTDWPPTRNNALAEMYGGRVRHSLT